MNNLQKAIKELNTLYTTNEYFDTTTPPITEKKTPDKTKLEYELPDDLKEFIMKYDCKKIESTSDKIVFFTPEQINKKQETYHKKMKKVGIPNYNENWVVFAKDSFGDAAYTIDPDSQDIYIVDLDLGKNIKAQYAGSSFTAFLRLLTLWSRYVTDPELYPYANFSKESWKSFTKEAEAIDPDIMQDYAFSASAAYVRDKEKWEVNL